MSLQCLSFVWSINQGPDSPHSWYNLFLMALFLMLSAGPRVFFGSLFVSLMDNFDMTRAEASTTFNYYTIPHSLSGIFVGFFTFKLGTKNTLYICMFFTILSTFCESLIPVSKDYLPYLHTAFVFHGFFMGLPFAMMLQLASLHFYVHRSKTMTMTCLFSGMCSITHPPLLIYILSYYGLRGYWLIHSTMLLQSVVPLALITVPKRRTNRRVRLEDTTGTKSKYEVKNQLSLSKDDVNYLSVKVKGQSSFYSVEKVICEQENLLQENAHDINFRSEVNKISNCELENSSSKIIVEPSIDFMKTSELKNQIEIIGECEEKTQTLEATRVGFKVNNQGPPGFFSILMPLCKNLNFYAQILCQLIGGGGQSIILATIVDFGIDNGLSFNSASYLIMSFSFGAAIGSIFSGWFLDKHYMNDKLFMALGMFVSGSLILVLSFSTSSLLFAMTFGVGLAYGATAITRLKLITIIGLETTSTILGFGFFASSCLYLALPAAIGLCRDQYGSYFYLYLPLSMLTFSVIILYLVIYWKDKKKMFSK